MLGAVPFPTNPILFEDGSDVIIMMERADTTAVVIDFGDQGNMPVLQKHITDVTSGGNTSICDITNARRF